LCIDDEEKLKRLERSKVLLEEFCHGDGDTGVLERWLSEMGIGWVLGLADDPSAGTSFLRAQPQRNNLAESWIRALTEITESTHLGYLQFLRQVLEEAYRERLLRIVEATVLKMLPFVDALLAADANTDTAGVSNGAQASSEKLQALLGVREALSRASEGIQLYFNWDSSAEIEAQGSKLLSLLSEKEHWLEEAIWNTMEEIRTCILSDGDDNNDWGIHTSQGSPDICKATRFLVTYIGSLWNNYWRLNRIVRAAAKLGAYVPNREITSSFLLSTEQEETDPFTCLALEMVFSLKVKLAQRSESFPDHSLRFLFLINNTHFIQQHLHPLFSMRYHTEVLTPKMEGYIQKYLQASWAPVMSCLYNHTPRWFRKNSALPKFDSEFQKTYSVHKLWKVPDPKLRTWLRKAIIKKVVPGLTRYLEDNNVVTSPGVTPQEREEMLLDLFEG
jgi:hypothetical protein